MRTSLLWDVFVVEHGDLCRARDGVAFRSLGSFG